VNSLPPDELDTVPFSTSFMVLPVSATALGMSPGDSSFEYSVRLSRRAAADSGARDSAARLKVGDQSDWMAYEVEAPGLDFSGGLPGPPTYMDLDDVEIPVVFDLVAFDEHRSLGILLLHHHNGHGQRAEVVTLAGELADLAAEMMAAPDPVLIGETVRYDITVENRGSVAALDALVRDELPDGVDFEPSLSDPSCGLDSGAVTCAVGEVAGGQSMVLRIVARVLASVPSGTVVVNHVVAEVGSIDPNPLNNAASVSTTAADVVPADLQVTKRTETAAAVPGDSIGYTITVTNAGPGDAADTVILDEFPEGLTDISWTCVATPGSACAPGPAAGDIDDTGNLIVGGTLTYEAQAVIRDSFQGQLTNSARAHTAAAVIDVDPGNNSSTAVTPVFPGLVFADGFESGDVVPWSTVMP